jgi:phenylacetate-CoA ligase
MAHLLDKIYPYAPIWMQNVGISLYGFAYQRERVGGFFKRHVAEFRQRDSWSPAQMQEYVETETQRVLLRAFEQVPYYRSRWKNAGIRREDLTRIKLDRLSTLPVTSKLDFRRDPDSFVARDAFQSMRLQRYYSSGSTGTPVTLICTATDHRKFIAAREVRSFGWAGSSVRHPRSMLGGRMIVPRGDLRPPFYRYNIAERQVYFSAYHIAPATVSNYVQGFNKYRPRLLTGYANSYYLLGRLMIEQGLSLGYEPDALILSSEKVTAEMKETIAQAFRARAYEEYSAVENCMLATECEYGSLHVSPDFGVIEIVDPAGNRVPAGVEGSIVCTGLVNNTQFLIRYEVGDRGSWSPTGCPCGRAQLPVLQEIVGRLEDVVVGPDGRQLVRFHWVFIDLPHVIEGQVIQDKIDQIRVRIVATGEFGDKDERVIRQRFRERLGNIQVVIEPVTCLERTERGKFRSVISHVKSNGNG